VTERIKLEAMAKRYIKIIIWKKTDQKESGTRLKLMAHSVNEGITTRGRIQKGHSETADAGSP